MQFENVRRPNDTPKSTSGSGIGGRSLDVLQNAYSQKDERRAHLSVVTPLSLLALLLHHKLPSTIELVDDCTALQYSELLGLLVVECRQLGRICLILYGE